MTETISTKTSGQIRRFPPSDLLAMFMVCFLSLVLLVYVGIGEAQRTYAGFLSAKMAAQGEIVQNAMAGHLQAGLPLRQFVGFHPLSTPILESDPNVAMITATDRTNKVVFTIKQPPPNHPSTDLFNVVQDVFKGEKFFVNDRYEVRQTNQYITVLLPLKSKFETVGNLFIVMPRAVVEKTVNVALVPLLALITLFSVIFCLFVVSTANSDESKRLKRQKWGLATCFILTSVVVVGLLVALYTEGAQAKAKALAFSLSERVSAISESRVDLSDLDGLDKAFTDYRLFNKDIESIGLLRSNSYVIHTDPARVGSQWLKLKGAFEYKIPLPNDPQGQKQEVTLALPVDVVYKAVADSAKNFFVLFFASGFLAALVLQLANAVQKSTSVNLNRSAVAESALEKVKPVLFLAVFIDNLSASFLPQLIRGSSDAARLPEFMTSVAFMAYFVCFAAILIPAGKLALRFGSKPLLWIGGLGIASGLGVLALTDNFVWIIFARVLAGLGQGILFIGVQTLVLSASSSGNENRANAIIVYNFNAGMVSGLAIGSLLVLYMGANGVFLFGLVGIVALTIYIMSFVPALPSLLEKASGQPNGGLLRVLRSFEFLRAMLFVGIPSKAVLTGVIMFGMPILLSQMAFDSDEIGQIIMFYALGVLLANNFLSNTKQSMNRVLNGGMLLGSGGLIVIGLFGLLPPLWAVDHVVLLSVGLVIGVFAVGLGHGAINAPVVTYVAQTELAKNVGMVTTTALYRVLERAGHVLGPMIVGQLLVFSGQSLLLVAWVGLALLLLTLLFQIGKVSPLKQAESK